MTEHARDTEAADGASFQSVAIIGAAGRFPGAEDVEAFWRNLAAGVESIRQYSDEELRAAGVPEAVLAQPGYVKAGARLDGAEDFDPEFFDMTPREAEITDPQHRVLLECAYHAMENAGYVASRYPGEVALYAGVGMNTYLINNLMPRPDVLQALGMHQLLLGNDKCYATSRIAYKLNLRGACVTIDTACSSGLVALTLAYRSLISFECDLALAGGAKVNAADLGYPYEPGSINSPDGHCRTFDAQARGTVFGSGAGMVVLKRLDDAIRDRDTIQAVIRGAAINNDGWAKVGFTAPSVTRQRDVIRQALAFSETDPASIGYVEAHGTGTQLGDPVELAALSEAFGPRGEGERCAIGSVKPNIGHLESAAGIAGVIKTVQALRRRQLPPSLHFDTANPALELERSPFQVNAELRAWPAGRGPRRACVSSFGLGGTNAHVVLEEAPTVRESASESLELLPISARKPATLERVAERLRTRLLAADAPALADAAHTLARGREPFEHRGFVLARSREDAAVALAQVTAVRAGTPKIAFLIPGQGVQYPGMAAELYARHPHYRRALEECCELLGEWVDLDLRALLTTPADADAPSPLDQTRYAQPATFATAYAAARLWMAWGVKPEAIVGHSLGEYVAACLAGVFPLRDALRLVCVRAGLMQDLPAGAMASLRMGEAAVRALLDAQPHCRCDIAAINGPLATVVSGPPADVAACIEAARAAGAEAAVLRTSHAFHSHMLEPMQAAFEQAFAGIALAAPGLSLTSSLTGRLLGAEQAVDPQYWSRQLRGCVRYADAIATVAGEGIDLMIDIGPGATASALARASVAAGTTVLAAGAARGAAASAEANLLTALGQAWRLGAPVDWDAVYAHRALRRVELPGYPFDRRRCWIEAEPVAASTGLAASPLAASALQAPAPSAASNAAAVSGQSAAAAEPADMEAAIAAIWRELLGVEALAMDDNFFALGGQSLLATRVLARIHESTGVELPMQAMFDHPTVAGLAFAVVQQRALMESPDLLERLLSEIESQNDPAHAA